MFIIYRVWSVLGTLFLLLILYEKKALGYTNSSLDFRSNQSQVLHLRDVLFKLAPPISLSLQDAKVSPLCRRHSEVFLRELEQLKLWAVQMYDANGKFPSGLLNGNVHVSGDVDTCQKISKKLSTNPKDLITGKFCQALIHVEPSASNPDLEDIMDLVHSHRAIQSQFDNDVNFFPSFSEMSWSFCIPSSCSARDLESVLTTLVQPYNLTTGLEIKLKVDPRSCEVQRQLFLNRPKSIMTLMILGLGFALCVLGGIYDFIYNNENCQIPTQSKLIQILYAFSLRRNLKLLTKITPDGDDITCVHGIRALFSLSIYLLHRSVFGLFQPFANRTEISEMMEGVASMVFRAFWNHVDTFVVLSGLLTSYYAVAKLQKGGRLNLPSMYIKRYLKFAPIYIITVLLVHFMFEFRVGASMFRVVYHFVDSCDVDLWKSLLFVSNVDGIDKMCYPPAHQLLTDFQMYLASPFVIMFLWKYSQHSFKILAAIIAALSVYKGLTIYFGGLGTVIYFGVSLQEMLDTANAMYLNPIHRATPYVCGMALGYCMRIWGKHHLNHDERNLGWCVTFLCAYYSFFALSDASVRGYRYDVVHATLYGVAQPLLWSAALCWTIYVCHTGNANLLNSFLSWRGFQLFSRIAYPFYMFQIIVIFLGIGGANVPLYARMHHVIDLNEFVLIIGCSILLTVVYMYPIAHLYSIFFQSHVMKTPFKKTPEPPPRRRNHFETIPEININI